MESDLTPSILRMLEQLDPPFLKGVKGVQDKLERLIPSIYKSETINQALQATDIQQIKTLLSSQEKLRLSISPQLKDVFQFQERLNREVISSTFLTPNDHWNKLFPNFSKWYPSIDTPANVIDQI